MTEDSNYVRVARQHFMTDEAIMNFFKKYASNTPEELREVLDDPYFNAGFVSALVYARKQTEGIDATKGDIAILADIIDGVIKLTRNTPHVVNN